MKILISGGHVTPALALIDYIQQEKPATKIVFVGRQFSRRELQQPSVEEAEVRARGVTFHPFDSGKLDWTKPLLLPLQAALVLRSFYAAWQLMRREDPDVFLSFGSYLAVPLAVVAKLRGKVVVTHEQTRTVGLATRIVSWFADWIAVSHAETASEFAEARTTVTGNPLRAELLKEKHPRPSFFPASCSKPILYITGGSQGSLAINQIVAKVLGELTEHWTVIHQCGKAAASRSPLLELLAVRDLLSPEQQQRYFCLEWISGSDVAWILQNADLIVGRSGANTVEEVSYFGVPAVYIPLPFARQNEQLRNAEAAVQNQAALLLPQEELTAERLLEVIVLAKQELKSLRAAAQTHRKDVLSDGAARLYALIEAAVVK